MNCDMRNGSYNYDLANVNTRHAWSFVNASLSSRKK